MIRTNKKTGQTIENRLPDAINASPMGKYTIIPNEILRNPEISATAKMILCILLSNTGKWYSYQTAIMGMMKEGQSAIRSGLQQLEEFHYLQRIKYRDIETKKWRGSFWAYTTTPGEFDITQNIEVMACNGLEMYAGRVEEGTVDISVPRFPTSRFPTSRKPTAKKTNSKKTNYKNIDSSEIFHIFDKSPKFNAAWLTWKKYKALEFGFRYKSDVSELAAINKLIELANKDENNALCIIKQSIENRWAGHFKLTEDKSNNKTKQRNGHVSIAARKEYTTDRIE